jgi:OOP family OmpA-OmpF porin
MGWPMNYDNTTYDKSKVNVVGAANDDYIEAGRAFITGQQFTLKLIENGKYTGRDTTLSATGVASWFPVDQQVVQKKGGVLTLASTLDYGSQMACGIVMIKKWADDNRPIVEKMIEAFGKAGEQIKSHDQALQFACQVNEVVFDDKEKTAEDWYKAFKSFPLVDDDGNEVQIGGSRVFSLADAAKYVGLTGGNDVYKVIYNMFGAICVEAYPEIISSYPDYAEVNDWSFLRAVYTKNKKSGTEGSISTIDYTKAEKSDMIGDASYSIEFATGSAEISPQSYATLDKIIATLTVASNSFVEIAGHTDNTGNLENNQTLSEMRAQSVASYLKSKDKDLASASKLVAKGYGQSKPLNPSDDQNSKSVRDRNRRVEVKLYRVKL